MNDLSLSPIESRVVGSLIEKDLTTPNSYPITLNALVAACNQKSNRHPVSAWTNQEIDEVLSLLVVKGWVTNVDGGGRVLRWKHRAGVMLEIAPEELAVMAELMLRGSQQPGELRSRVDRMHRVPNQADLMRILDSLMNRDPPLVQRHSRRSGERADRFGQTLSPVEEPAEAASRPVPEQAGRTIEPPDADLMARLAALEQEVATLRRVLEELGSSESQPRG